MQTSPALFQSGDYRTKKITPAQAGGALTVGSVLVIGDLTCVVHNIYTADDHAKGEPAVVAYQGGIYSVRKAIGSGAIGDGTKLYWDSGNNGVATTGTDVFGWAAEESGASAPTLLAAHEPALK